MSPEHLMLLSDCLLMLQNNDQGDLLRLLAADQAFVWDPVEVIGVGHQRQKELLVSLEDVAWERRVFLWLAALRVLNSFQ